MSRRPSPRRSPRPRATLETLERRELFAATSLDPSFGGGDGMVLTPTAMTIGRVDAVPGGGYVAPLSQSFGATRFRVDGTLDTSFGVGGADGDGVASTSFPNVTGARSLFSAPAPGGKVVVVGTGADNSGHVSNSVVLIARFNADGTLDGNFAIGGADGDGRAVHDLTDAINGATVADAVVQSNGRILVAGTAGDAGYVARFRDNGTLEESFGANGTGMAMVKPFAAYDAGIEDIDLMPDGRIVAAGTTGRPDPEIEFHTDVVAARFTPAGAPDPTFDGDGVVVSDVGSLLSGNSGDVDGDFGTAVKALPDGRVLVGATTFADGTSGSAILIHSPAGRPVQVITNVVPDDETEMTAFAARPGGGFVAVGTRPEADGTPVGARDFFLAGYRADGSPDPAYQPAGRADFRPGDTPDAVVVRPDGRIEVAGRAAEGQSTALALARFLGDSTQTPVDQTYQAEAARVSGATVARSHAGYTGTGYVDYANASGDFIEWTIQVPAAGTYDLDFRFANGSSSARILKIDGATNTSAVQFGRTGSWSTWQTAGARATLTAGTHTVRLTAIGESGPNIDSLRVRATDPPTSTQTLQAEHAVVTGATFSRNRTGYTGNGYIDFAHASGDSIEWNVTVGETRAYALEFRYANGGSANRPLSLIVDGVVANISMPFAPTGSWDTWRVQSATVTLTAGPHRIRLQATGAGGGNIDALTVR